MKRLIFLAVAAAALLPILQADAQVSFEYANFPEPAENKFNIVGGALESGRLLVWNGDALFEQNGFKLDAFMEIADGYDGDPVFLAMSPSRDRALLGAGSSGNIYDFDPNEPRDYASSRILTNRPHTGGAFLTDTLFLIDAIVPNQGASELVIIDLEDVKGGLRERTVVQGRPKQTVVDKPDGSLPAQIVVSIPDNAVYAMDVTTRQVRQFSFSAIINAYDDEEVLDWSIDGLLVGEPGRFYDGGLSGLTDEGLLIIGGAFTSSGPGGVQLVDPIGGTVVRAFAPGGQNGVYRVIWNPISQVISARVNLRTFGIDLKIAAPEGEGEGEGGGEGEGEGINLPEGEGGAEGEGERSNEGEGEGDAVAEGESEGEATEGEGEEEGEFTGPCLLEDLSFDAPEDASTVFVSSSVGTFDIPLQAVTNCEADTARVEFLLTEPSVTGGARRTRFATAVDAPYQAVLPESRLSTRGQRFLLTARAIPLSSAPVLEETIGVTVVAPDTSADLDRNGIPDAPFETLSVSGDRWLNSAALAPGLLQMFSSVTALYSASAVKQDLAESIVVQLKSPVNTGQVVTVTAPKALVRSNERGLLVVQLANELASLVGPAEAANFGREPDGRLRGDGQYLHISLLVSSDGGDSYAPIADTRLNSNPIEVVIEGLPLTVGKDYALASHPATLSQTDAGPVVLASSDVWSTLESQTVLTASGRAEGVLSELGVIAPFEILDDSAYCINGNCIPPLFGIEFFILLALGILQFVDGGVGGGSPCFIATAAYGTPLAAQIDVLRGLRDHTLLESTLGTAFVDLYYHLSPSVADWIAVHPAVALIVRLLLLPVILGAQVPAAAWGSALFAILLWRYRLRSRRSQ